MVIHSQLVPHFAIEYSKHFTGFHNTVGNVSGIRMGATEMCVIIIGLQLFYAIMGNERVTNVYNFKDFNLPIDYEFTEA